MPTNEFLPIAIGGSANVAAQATYAASADVATGFANGEIPASNIFNKMVRQASMIASQLAQTVCDITGLNMLDNATPATTLANLKTLLQVANAKNFYTDTGAVNAYIVAMSPVLAARVTGMRVSVKIGASHTNTGASTLNLGPAAVSIKTVFGLDPPAGTLKAGSTYEFLDDGTNYILLAITERIISFTGNGPALTSFGVYQLGGGLILQWGVIGGGGTGASSATFPMAFNTLHAIWACAYQSPGGAGGASIYANGYPNSNTQFQANTNNVAYAVIWIAIGI